MSSFLARRAMAAPRLLRNFSSTTSRSYAKITIVGNLADTPEMQATSTGRNIMRYAVASSHGPVANRQTSWFRVTSFDEEGPRRDYLQSLPKGTLVLVEGEATMSTYDNAEGRTETRLSIVQRNIEVLRKPKTDAAEGQL